MYRSDATPRRSRISLILQASFYTLLGAFAVTAYAREIALIGGDGAVRYFLMAVLGFATVIFGQLVLNALALRFSRPRPRHPGATLPSALVIQIVLFGLLALLRNVVGVHFLLQNKVTLPVVVIGFILLANIAAIGIVRRFGFGFRAPRFAPYVIMAVALVLALAPFAFTDRHPSQNGKSVLLVTVDSWRYDHTGFVSDDVITPNVNTLHDSGITFDNFVAHAPYTWTALSSIMTSLEGPFHQVRVNGLVLNDKYLTLSEIMRDNGYSCFLSCDIATDLMGLTQGFEGYPKQKELAVLAFYSFNMAMAGVFPDFFQRHCFGPNNSMPTTLRALEFLRENRSEQFFLWVHYYDEPHLPYIAPGYFQARYNDGRSSWMDGSDDVVHALRGNPKLKHILEGKTISDSDLEFFVNTYRAEVTAMDTQLGMILESLRQYDLLDEVMVVLTADHGEDFNDRGQYTHGGNLYKGLLHVPLIVKLPGPSEPRRVAAMARGIDIAPTIIDYAGIEIPHGFHGRSLLPLAAGRSSPAGDVWCYSETLRYGMGWPYKGYAFCYTSPQYKYISIPLDDKEELYDLVADPDERANIAAENPEKVAAIEDVLMGYFELEDISELIPPMNIEIKEKQLEMLKALGYVD